MNTPLHVRVNGEPCDVARDTTVRALLLSMGALRDGVAVALNDEIVLRSAWGDVALRDDDSVEVLSAAPGG